MIAAAACAQRWGASLTRNGTHTISSYTRVLSSFRQIAAPEAPILKNRGFSFRSQVVGQAKTAPYYSRQQQQQQQRWLASKASDDDDTENENDDDQQENDGNASDEKWMNHYNELIQYKEQHGEDPLVRLQCPENPKLRHWVYTQRRECAKLRKGEKAFITQERIQRLDDIGFVWNAYEIWDTRYQQLQDYREQEGNCLVPQIFPKNPDLGHWVGKQRENYKLLQDGKPTSLTQERIQKLEEIEFVWNVNDAIWNAKYQELQAYHKNAGDCTVPQKYPELGRWVDTQRQHYRLFQENKKTAMTKDLFQEEKKTAMTPERIELLERLDFDWDPLETVWMNHYHQLEEFAKQDGHCMVPGRLSKLRSWVRRQRQNYLRLKAGKPSPMTPERLNLLERIHFQW